VHVAKPMILGELRDSPSRHYNVTAGCGRNLRRLRWRGRSQNRRPIHSHHHMPLHLFTAAKNKRDVGLLQCRPLDSTASLLQQSSARHELPPDCPPPRSATNNSTDSTRSSNSTATETRSIISVSHQTCPCAEITATRTIRMDTGSVRPCCRSRKEPVASAINVDTPPSSDGYKDLGYMDFRSGSMTLTASCEDE